jgi:hypothetical protein
VIFTHHDPIATDDQLLQVIEADKEYYDIQQKVSDHKFEWMLAYDGLELDI